MACRSCDLKRIYKLFEEKKRREAEEAKALAEAAEFERKQEEEMAHKETESIKRAREKKTYESAEPVVEVAEEQIVEEAKLEEFSDMI